MSVLGRNNKVDEEQTRRKDANLADLLDEAVTLSEKVQGNVQDLVGLLRRAAEPLKEAEEKKRGR